MRLPTIGNAQPKSATGSPPTAPPTGGFELIVTALPEVYVGCGFASWNLAARA